MSKNSNLLYSNDIAGCYPNSWYAASANGLPERPSLRGEREFDVCIVGGGFTGLSTALHLTGQGYRVAVLEAHRVGWGASGRNGGQLGSGQRLQQDELETRYGVVQAHKLWALAEDAKALVVGLIGTHGIDCDLTAGILYTDHKARYSEQTKIYTEKLQQQYGYDRVRYVARDELCEMLATPAYFSAALDSGAYHLHPLNYALGLASAAQSSGVEIFENTPVRSIQSGDPVLVRTAEGSVRAKMLVLACNGYLGNLNREVAARVMPINNFILATEPLSPLLAQQVIRDNVAVADSKFVVNYYRLSPDRRLLFGGRESYGYRFPSNLKSFIRQAMVEIYPQLAEVNIDYGWGGTLAITRSRMPHLQRVQKNIISASGYSGHGLGMATLSGKLVAQAIAGSLERFDVLAGLPNKPFPGGVMARSPLLAMAMLYYKLRDKL